MKFVSIKRILFVVQFFVNSWLIAADYPITSYLGIEQGLSNNSVRCIYQDKKGFMWFGTYDGLNRYDGYTFKVFRNNFTDPGSLVNNWINAIDEDANGNIWIGTRQGVCIYRGLFNRFSSVRYTSLHKKTSKVTSVIRDIERDEKGNMFIGTADAGLIFVSNGDTSGFQVPFENLGVHGLSLDVPAIKRSAGNNMWVFIRDKGLCLYDNKLKKLRLVNSDVTSANCLETKGNFLWVGTNRGIFRFNILTGTYERFYNETNGLSNKDVIGLTLDRNDRLWVATNGGGVNVLDLSTGQSTHMAAGKERYSLSSNSVYAVLEDQEARIWIGSLRGGINIIDQHKKVFQTVVSDPASSNTLISNYIFSFYEASNGKLWVGTDGDGLSIWDRKANRFTNFKHNPADPASLSNDFITDIIGDFQNNIWIATYRGGVNRYNKVTDRFERYRITPTSDKGAMDNPLSYSLLEDHQRNLWAGSLQWGLFKLNRLGNAFEIFDPRLKDLLVMFEDKYNVVWAGNLSQLLQIDRVNKKHQYFPIGKPVRSIHEDGSGNFWVGSEGGGLLLFDRKKRSIIARYTTDEGLCSNSVLNILEDNSGNLWLSTFNGISRFNPKSKTFTNYYHSDGLQSNQFNYNAALKLRTGELVFGGIKGFTIFNPANITIDDHFPRLYFTDIRISNTPIEDESSVIAKAEANDIRTIKVSYEKAILLFEFAALEYSAPDKVQYAYYLEGWDRGWNYISNTRTATYTHLTEGNYTLRLKCTNTAGVWGTKELKLNIIVLPPWYRSWWAYLGYTIILGSFIYAYVGYRSRQTQLKYRVRIANLNAENERTEKLRSQAELEKEKIERQKREAELALERAEKDKGFAELAFEKARLEKEKAERERQQAEREKERILIEKEREINEKKISFFTNISHEFRTPLTLIINPIKDLLKKKGEDQARQDSELGIVYRNARRLLSLVDQLLLFRKAESGLDRIQPSRLNLFNLAWEVYLCFTHQAKSRNITYIFECSNQQLEVYADREKLEIILFNLLSNALKYTPTGGRINFTIVEKPEDVVIEVQDTGSGIPGEIGGRLFEKFYKAERTNTTSQSGFGIGLFLVKHFTEQHKGTISYQSEEGKGASFTLSLLKGKDHFGTGTNVSESESGPVFLEELKEEHPFEEAVVKEEKSPTADIVTEKEAILIVDDDVQVRQYLAQLFKERYIIHQAENGDDGLRAAQTYLPDLVISDVNMEGMNGIELCKQIKESDSLNHIPVILLTASSSDELKLKGVEGGADDYLTKPFDTDLLMARVINLLKSRNNLQKYFYNEITLNKNNQRISPEYKEFLEKCISVVERHLDDDEFSVKALQREMGMSYSNLHRKVKSVSGLSANVFIRFIRLRKAAEMFINTNYNVNETALRVGINDLKYFREQFYRLFGLNPSEYIKNFRRVHGKQYMVDKESISPEK